MTQPIDPATLIESYSLDEHLRFADAYFKGREEHIYLYQKPFHHPRDCAASLSNLGLLLAGAELEAGMRVLDFAAGSCWLSRILVQLGCVVTSCDASATALEIGKALFERYPPITKAPSKPTFSLFDGERLDFPDDSFDRVIVNDAFHHVPNTQTVLAEFCRVLKKNGRVSMSEPGRHHSRTPDSQHEMQRFSVIENDLVLEDLWREAWRAGFRGIRICPVLRYRDLTIEDYLDCIAGRIPSAVSASVIQDTINHSIFVLYKQPIGPGPFVCMAREDFDEAFYLERYPDVAAAVANGRFADGWQHYERHGRKERRLAREALE